MKDRIGEILDWPARHYLTLAAAVCLAFVILSALLTTGCATMNLSKDATPADKQHAYCTDVAFYMAVVNSHLNTGVPGTSYDPPWLYWTASRDAANAYLMTYCAGPPVVNMPSPDQFVAPLPPVQVAPPVMDVIPPKPTAKGVKK